MKNNNARLKNKTKMKLTKVFPIIAMLLIVLVTGCKKDGDPAIRPVVSATYPLSNATNSAISGKISATFSVSGWCKGCSCAII